MNHLYIRHVLLFAILCGNVGCFAKWKDVTNDPRYRGDYQVGATYRLKHGAYVWGSRKFRNYDLLAGPLRYGDAAIDEAKQQYGSVLNVPPDFVGLRTEKRFRAEGRPVWPPVEELEPGTALPEGVLDTIPAGTEFKLESIQERLDFGGRIVFYVARATSGRYAKRRVSLSSLGRVYDRVAPGSFGFGPNPLMLEVVADPATSQPIERD